MEGNTYRQIWWRERTREAILMSERAARENQTKQQYQNVCIIVDSQPQMQDCHLFIISNYGSKFRKNYLINISTQIFGQYYKCTAKYISKYIY